MVARRRRRPATPPRLRPSAGRQRGWGVVLTAQASAGLGSGIRLEVDFATTHPAESSTDGHQDGDDQRNAAVAATETFGTWSSTLSPMMRCDRGDASQLIHLTEAFDAASAPMTNHTSASPDPKPAAGETLDVTLAGKGDDRAANAN